MSNLWSNNTPQKFWLCQPDAPAEVWRDAVCNTLIEFNLPLQAQELDGFLCYILGEGQFGQNCWKLNPLKRSYYFLKPLLPCQLRYILRRIYKHLQEVRSQLNWPVEDGYVRFQHEVIRRVLNSLNRTSLTFFLFLAR